MDCWYSYIFSQKSGWSAVGQVNARGYAAIVSDKKGISRILDTHRQFIGNKRKSSGFHPIIFCYAARFF